MDNLWEFFNKKGTIIQNKIDSLLLELFLKVVQFCYSIFKHILVIKNSKLDPKSISA